MRRQITDNEVTKGIDFLVEALDTELSRKGYGTFSSRHEVFGAVSEEFYELAEAVRGPVEDFEGELADLCVACLFGLICIRAGSLEW